MADALGDHDAVGLAALVRSGEVKPLELVDAAIARIETVDTQLNAVIHRRFERARAEAGQLHLAPPSHRPRPGQLAGVPFLVKDIACHQAGEPFHEGMRFLRDRAWRATSDSYLAARFRAAGLITVGRTNAPELGIVPTTEPLAYGPTRNPWDRSRSPGGSSGGSAAAVAAGLVPAAHANDGGGSIRIPASACGLVGLKPSRGRASLGPDASFSALVVCEHVVSRTVRDSAAFLDVIAGPMPGDPYVAPAPVRPFRDEVGADPGRLRIGVMTAAPGGLAAVAPECVVAAQRTSEALESLGHHVESAHPAALDLPDWSAHFISLWSAGVALGLDSWSARVGAVIGADDVEPLTWMLAEMARALPTPSLLRSLDWLLRTTRLVAEWWEPPDSGASPASPHRGFDLLLTPTLAEPPVLLGTFDSPPENPLAGLVRAAAFTPFTPPFNVTGQPAISLPGAPTRDGLPIGVQLVAAYGREDVLLRVAAQLEEADPWASRSPPISVGG
jgi:amidase